MATSLSKIKNQIEKLQKQAESIQFTVISRIKKDIAQHGLKRPGFRGGSNTGEWSHEEVPEVFA